MLDPRKPSRRASGMCALMLAVSAPLLAVLGGFFKTALVQPNEGNAPLWVGIISVPLLGMSAYFALAALLPYGAIRRSFVALGTALAGVVFALAGLLLITALLIIPFQSYPYATNLFIRHLVGLILLMACAYVAGYRIFR